MITGASAGVGRAVARAFGCRGASVGLLARGRAGLEGAARDVEAQGGRALILQADVADADRVESAAATLEERFGPIDVWVNNAMASVFSPVIEMEPAEFKRVTDVTYLGVVYGTLAAAGPSSSSSAPGDEATKIAQATNHCAALRRGDCDGDA